MPFLSRSTYDQTRRGALTTTKFFLKINGIFIFVTKTYASLKEILLSHSLHDSLTSQPRPMNDSNSCILLPLSRVPWLENMDPAKSSMLDLAINRYAKGIRIPPPHQDNQVPVKATTLSTRCFYQGRDQSQVDDKGSGCSKDIPIPRIYRAKMYRAPD